MHATFRVFAAPAFAQSQAQAAQAQAAQVQAEAAARAAAEVARANADVARQNAAQIRDQLREQAQDFKENLRTQIQAEIDAARAAQEHGVPMPPSPPSPPDWRDFTTQTGRGDIPDIPPQAVEIVSIVGVTLVCCVVGFPIARAFARWLDRRGTSAPVSAEVTNRLHAIEQAVESVALEVERISEGQRFTTRVLSERAHEPVAEYYGREREPLHAGLPADSGPGAPVNARRS